MVMMLQPRLCGVYEPGYEVRGFKYCFRQIDVTSAELLRMLTRVALHAA
jgi:hypothetical protein